MCFVSCICGTATGRRRRQAGRQAGCAARGWLMVGWYYAGAFVQRRGVFMPARGGHGSGDSRNHDHRLHQEGGPVDKSATSPRGQSCSGRGPAHAPGLLAISASSALVSLPGRRSGPPVRKTCFRLPSILLFV
ncbi:unnamed protein product [Ectocarpus sp. 12 AP-2014]